ncbi:PD-(D/E)XK nuclease family protein [Alkalicoccobacillus plakortidis]|uniref:PD-(D/E)XK nuclease family protein n=1 Tax=Alkalicoccobacillus plakortidis TaxID=444060 RepID=A0ABT0XHE9_9BACI|nr:PD-(D/E)XK nuclease family protein [Alkalicoccobacillus plakortidis]MCM2675130.1 PD-(D/E)XK nuclease family protein [Alkalicoccobacillus plakortidis]
MATQSVFGTALHEIGSLERIKQYAHVMQEHKSTIMYLMPSSSWLKEARSSHYPLTFGTFDDLASSMIKHKNMAFLSLTEQERTLFFQRILEQQLQVDARSPKEKARAYADTYGQLKRLGLSIDAVEESFKDCMPTFRAYEQLLEDYGAIDPENKLLLAASLLQQKKEIPDWHVVVDGFYDFSPLQFKLIEALYQADIPTTIYLPHYAPLDIVDETVADLQKIGYDTSGFAIVPTQRIATSVSLVKATTVKEQWTGLTQDIKSTSDTAGVVLTAEDRDEWRRAADEEQLPITHAVTKKLKQTTAYKLLEHMLQTGYDQKQNEALVLDLLSFYGVAGTAFAKAKYMLKRTGQTGLQDIEEKRDQINQVDWAKQSGFIDYLDNLLHRIDELELADWIENQLAEAKNLKDIEHLKSEQKALATIKQTIDRKAQEYRHFKMDTFTVSNDYMEQWIKDTLQDKEISLKQGLRTGTEAYTWQHVAQFPGRTLYIPSMGADQFPGGYSLAGYIQESDLYKYDIPYGKPSQAHFRKKQQAYFEQLFYIAEKLVFSYIEGVDPNHPLLPSIFLESVPPVGKWSFEMRMAKDQASHVIEQQEMLAYWRGRQYQVDDLPEDFQLVEQHLSRLQSGEEPISMDTTDRLKQQASVAITALESYARCPIRYSFERLLQVKEPETEETGVSFILIGNLVHELIEWLYKELDVIGRPFSMLSETEKEKAPQMIQDKVEKEWLLIEAESPHVSKLELNLLKQQWQTRLLEWWKAERKLFWDNEKLANMSITSLERPLHMELAISEAERIILKGKIDRVDQLDHEFVIYDYKTGQSSLKMEEEVRNGLKLQLPLYSYILRDLLEKQTGVSHQAIGASYITLRAPGKRSNNGIWHEAEVGKQSRFLVNFQCKNRENELGTQEFLDKYELEDKVRNLWTGMTSEFPVKPLDCKDSCPYGPICRVSDEQKEANAIT